MKKQKNKIKNKERKKESKKVRKIRKTRFVVFILIILIIVAAVIFLLNYNESDKFIYHGKTWKIEYKNNLTFYTIRLSIPRTREIENSTEQENYTLHYNLKLINDPRILDRIPQNIEEMPHKKTYLSIDESIMGCKNNVLAAWEIGEFLGALGIEAEGAVTSLDIFEEILNKDYLEKKVKTCADADQNTTILILKSDEINQIFKDSTNENCFILQAKECETLEITERYLVALVDLMP